MKASSVVLLGHPSGTGRGVYRLSGYKRGAMSDARTLRLAHPDVTPEKLEAFMLYERTLLIALMETSGDDWAGRFAFGHAKALKVANLDPLWERKIAAAAATFCGRCSSAQTVRAKIAELEARRATLTPREASILAKAPAELAKLEDLSELEQSLGPVTLASFKAREVELVELHRAMASAEGRGHVHFKGNN